MTLRLGEILKDKGYTYSDLEKLMIENGTKLSSVSISNIVTGKQSPKVETLEHIAKALKIPVAECFENTAPQEMNTIYKRDESGNYVEIGYLKNTSSKTNSDAESTKKKNVKFL